MDHEYFKDRLSGYHEGGLKPEEMQILREHVEQCAECQAQLEQYRKLDKLIDDKCDLSDSAYWEESARKIEERLGFEGGKNAEITNVKHGLSWMSWKVVTTVAAALVLTFVGLHQTDIMKMASESPSVESYQDKIQSLEDDSLDSSDDETELDYDGSPVLEDEGAVTRSDQDAPAERMELHEVALEVPAPAAVMEDRREKDEVSDGASNASEDSDYEPAKGLVRVRETDIVSKFTISRQAEGQPEPKPKVIVNAQPLPSETIKKKPVTSVEELLEYLDSVPGVITDSSGEIFIRGGRSGEVKYIVNGAVGSHELDPLARQNLHLVEGTPSDDIDHWRSIRDSIKPLVISEPVWASEAAPAKPKDQKKTKSSSTAYQQTLKYIEALYHIGRLTDDEDEYEETMERLKKYRKSRQETIKEQAVKYYKLLEGRFE